MAKKAGVREEGAREPGVCSVSVVTITARILSRALVGWLGDFKRRPGAEEVDCLAVPRGSKFKVISDFKASLSYEATLPQK